MRLEKLMRTTGIWFLVLAGIIAPTVAAVAVVRSARGDVTAVAQELWTPAVPVEGGLETTVSVLVERQVPPAAPAPAWNGIVEEVHVAPGSQLQTGTPVALVGGITRIATSVGTPIGRVLRQGDVGRDVQSLNETLVALGYLANDDNRYTVATRNGVRRLAEDLGAGSINEFDPAWFVFLPGGDATVASTELLIGRPAPAAGTDVIAFRPVPTRARVVATTDVPSGTAGEDNPVDLDDVDSTLDIPDDATVEIGGATVSVDAVGMISPEQFEVISTQLATDKNVLMGQMIRELPIALVQVPTAAVFTGPTGKTCVAARRNLDTNDPIGRRDVKVRLVEVIDSYIGTAFVTGVELGAEVQLSPSNELRKQCQ